MANGYRTGRWSRKEHYNFLKALKLFGKDWKKVQEYVITRTSTQARSHAQKFFAKLERNDFTLREFLEHLDLDKLQQRCTEHSEDPYDEEEDIKNMEELAKER